MVQASTHVPLDFSGYDACNLLPGCRTCAAVLVLPPDVPADPFPSGVCVPAACDAAALGASADVLALMKLTFVEVCGAGVAFPRSRVHHT